MDPLPRRRSNTHTQTPSSASAPTPAPRRRNTSSSNYDTKDRSMSSSQPDYFPRPRHRSGTESTGGRSRSHRDSMSYGARSDMTPSGTESDREWDEGFEVKGGEGSRRRRKKDEPMKPLTVILYVVFFYLIWQILTRSDESEILSHLPITSPLHSMSSSFHNLQQHYPLPYNFPHIPSPISSTSSASPIPGDAPSTSTFRAVLGVIVYPVYLIVTLLAIPLPLLSSGLQLILSLLTTILHPLTSTIRVLSRTFLLAPLNMLGSVLAVFYPLYVFVAGVTGVGCVMGVGAGWMAKIGLDWMLGRRKSDKAKRGKRKVEGGSRSQISTASRSKSKSGRSKLDVVDRHARLTPSLSQYAHNKNPTLLPRGPDQQYENEYAVNPYEREKSQSQSKGKTRNQRRTTLSPSSTEEQENLHTPRAPVRSIFPEAHANTHDHLIAEEEDDDYPEDEYYAHEAAPPPHKGKERAPLLARDREWRPRREEEISFASGRDGRAIGVRRRGTRDGWAER